MIMRMFALKDSKMNMFMNPMFFNSRAQALRVVQDEVNRPIQGAEPATTLQSHPEDIALYEVGEFDNESGFVVAPREPVLIEHCSKMVIGRS